MFDICGLGILMIIDSAADTMYPIKGITCAVLCLSAHVSESRTKRDVVPIPFLA